MLSYILCFSLLFNNPSDTLKECNSDSCKLAYINYLLDDYHPYGDYLRFAITDSIGNIWYEMVEGSRVKKRYYPIVGNDHAAYKAIVGEMILRKDPIYRNDTANHFISGFKIQEDYKQIFHELPLNVFLRTYFKETGSLKYEYEFCFPAIMDYLFDKQIVFIYHGGAETLYIDPIAWEKLKQYIVPAKLNKKGKVK